MNQGRGNPIEHLRIIAVSATLPNPDDVARWIGAQSDAMFSFPASYRPVPLTTHVIGYHQRSNHDYFFEKHLDSCLPDVVRNYSDGKPTLIFCATRNGVKTAADSLMKHILTVNPGSIFPNKGGPTNVERYFGQNGRGYLQTMESYLACMEASFQVQDQNLRQFLQAGVGFHSAEASYNDRRIIENLFRSGQLPILCSTSTLALGVNLPAHLVIVKSTRAWRGTEAKYTEYPISTVLQMIGRAGRPGFDTQGVAVIMTQPQYTQRYRNFVHGTESIESSFFANLTEQLAAEIVLETVTSVTDCMQWLRSTFLYQRLSKRGSHRARYNIPNEASQSTVDGLLLNKVAQSLFQLSKAGFIALKRPFGGIKTLKEMQDAGFDETNVEFDEWNIGHPNEIRKCDANLVRMEALESCSLFSRSYLKFETVSLFHLLPRNASLMNVLEMCCQAKELENIIVLRRDHKRMLREVKERLGRFTVKKGTSGKVDTISDKAFQLAQIGLGRIEDAVLDFEKKSKTKTTTKFQSYSFYTLKMEMNQTMDILWRVIQAFYNWTMCSDVKSPLYPIASSLYRAIGTRTWPDTSTELQLLQFPGITKKNMSLLPSLGIQTIHDIAVHKLSIHAIQKTLELSQTAATTLYNTILGTFPRFSVRYEAGKYPEPGHSQVILTVFEVTGTNASQLNSQAESGTNRRKRKRFSYSLAITTPDVHKCGGLAWIRTQITKEGTFIVQIPRPESGPRLQVHLLHSKFLGLDSRLTIEPVYKENAPDERMICASKSSENMSKSPLNDSMTSRLKGSLGSYSDIRDTGGFGNYIDVPSEEEDIDPATEQDSSSIPKNASQSNTAEIRRISKIREEADTSIFSELEKQLVEDGRGSDANVLEEEEKTRSKADSVDSLDDAPGENEAMTDQHQLMSAAKAIERTETSQETQLWGGHAQPDSGEPIEKMGLNCENPINTSDDTTTPKADERGTSNITNHPWSQQPVPARRRISFLQDLVQRNKGCVPFAIGNSRTVPIAENIELEDDPNGEKRMAYDDSGKEFQVGATNRTDGCVINVGASSGKVVISNDINQKSQASDEDIFDALAKICEDIEEETDSEKNSAWQLKHFPSQVEQHTNPQSHIQPTESTNSPDRHGDAQLPRLELATIPLMDEQENTKEQTVPLPPPNPLREVQFDKGANSQLRARNDHVPSCHVIDSSPQPTRFATPSHLPNAVKNPSKTFPEQGVASSIAEESLMVLDDIPMPIMPQLRSLYVPAHLECSEVSKEKEIALVSWEELPKMGDSGFIQQIGVDNKEREEVIASLTTKKKKSEKPLLLLAKPPVLGAESPKEFSGGVSDMESEQKNEQNVEPNEESSGGAETNIASNSEMSDSIENKEGFSWGQEERDNTRDGGVPKGDERTAGGILTAVYGNQTDLGALSTSNNDGASQNPIGLKQANGTSPTNTTLGTDIVAAKPSFLTSPPTLIQRITQNSTDLLSNRPQWNFAKFREKHKLQKEQQKRESMSLSGDLAFLNAIRQKSDSPLGNKKRERSDITLETDADKDEKRGNEPGNTNPPKTKDFLSGMNINQSIPDMRPRIGEPTKPTTRIQTASEVIPHSTNAEKSKEVNVSKDNDVLESINGPVKDIAEESRHKDLYNRLAWKDGNTESIPQVDHQDNSAVYAPFGSRSSSELSMLQTPTKTTTNVTPGVIPTVQLSDKTHSKSRSSSLLSSTLSMVISPIQKRAATPLGNNISPALVTRLLSSLPSTVRQPQCSSPHRTLPGRDVASGSQTISPLLRRKLFDSPSQPRASTEQAIRNEDSDNVDYSLVVPDIRETHQESLSVLRTISNIEATDKADSFGGSSEVFGSETQQTSTLLVDKATITEAGTLLEDTKSLKRNQDDVYDTIQRSQGNAQNQSKNVQYASKKSNAMEIREEPSIPDILEELFGVSPPRGTSKKDDVSLEHPEMDTGTAKQRNGTEDQEIPSRGAEPVHYALDIIPADSCVEALRKNRTPSKISNTNATSFSTSSIDKYSANQILSPPSQSFRFGTTQPILGSSESGLSFMHLLGLVGSKSKAPPVSSTSNDLTAGNKRTRISRTHQLSTASAVDSMYDDNAASTVRNTPPTAFPIQPTTVQGESSFQSLRPIREDQSRDDSIDGQNRILTTSEQFTLPQTPTFRIKKRKHSVAPLSAPSYSNDTDNPMASQPTTDFSPSPWLRKAESLLNPEPIPPLSCQPLPHLETSAPNTFANLIRAGTPSVASSSSTSSFPQHAIPANAWQMATPLQDSQPQLQQRPMTSQYASTQPAAVAFPLNNILSRPTTAIQHGNRLSKNFELPITPKKPATPSYSSLWMSGSKDTIKPSLFHRNVAPSSPTEVPLGGGIARLLPAANDTSIASASPLVRSPLAPNSRSNGSCEGGSGVPVSSAWSRPSTAVGTATRPTLPDDLGARALNPNQQFPHLGHNPSSFLNRKMKMQRPGTAAMPISASKHPLAFHDRFNRS